MNPSYKTSSGALYCGDVLEGLQSLEDKSVQTCITSPPYWGLRDYGVDGQLGLEKTPEEYVEKLVAVFREVRRVLRDDGTVWLNLGDSYNGSGGAGGDYSTGGLKEGQPKYGRKFASNLKPKDLVGIPWRVAFALQADGWYLRQDIIWAKPNPMPESVRDRCTKAHEYIFLLSKSARYYYDNEAIKEEAVLLRNCYRPFQDKVYENMDINRQCLNPKFSDKVYKTRNKRSVWTVPTKGFPGAHFATFPPDLITPCILAGAPVGGVVLDPFMGAGTTALTSQRLGRKWVGIELNPEYAELIKKRFGDTCPLFV